MSLRTANIIGSGPNGLAAAITLAQAGVAVIVFEKNPWPGGAAATREITLPGFRHDLGSSAFPMGVASPFFRSLALERFGLQWIEPEIPLAHPMDGGSAALLEHALTDMPRSLGDADGRAWQGLLAPLVRRWPALAADVLAPALRVPRHPLAMAAFGAKALLPAATVASRTFAHPHARALFAGCAAHSVLPLTQVSSAAVALVLAAAGHASGWPVVAGGAGRLSEAMVALLESLGGTLVLDHTVASLRDLPPADSTLFDTSAEALLALSGSALSPSFQTRLRHFRRGPGVFKLDWALAGPIPWAAEGCRRAATVHVCGTMEEVAASEHAMSHGRVADRPFVLLVQPSVCDPGRAPAGRHTAWGYCHVPNGFSGDLTDAIETQVERFAPGFRDCILARVASAAPQLETWNPNLVGGDIAGGSMTLSQLLARPTLRQWRTSNRSLYLCSASTPPGGGVHGMCGHLAARAALADHGAPA